MDRVLRTLVVDKICPSPFSFSLGVGIGGRSWGGLLTLLALHHREPAVTGAFTGSGSNVVACENLNFRAFPGLFQCGVAISPITDFLSLSGGANDVENSPAQAAAKAALRALTSDLLGGWHGNNLEVRTYAKQISPTTAAHPPVAPLLLLHGQADPVVPIAQSRLYAERVLKKAVRIRTVGLAAQQVDSGVTGFDGDHQQSSHSSMTNKTRFEHGDIRVAGHLLWPSEDECAQLWEFEQEDHGLSMHPETRRQVLQKLLAFYRAHLMCENFAY